MKIYSAKRSTVGWFMEAGVKSFNAHFKRLIGQQKYNFEEFTTILVRIESVLNSIRQTSQSSKIMF